MGKGKGLSAVLVGSHLCHNLGGYIAGSEKAVGLFNHGLGNHRAVLQHILQVDQVTVMLLLRIVIGIMEVNNSLFMGLYNILRKQKSSG